MATAQATGDFRHELVLHEGPAELVELVVPSLRDAAAVGDHVVVLGEPDFVDALLAAETGNPAVDVVAESVDERYPGRDLHRLRQLLEQVNRPGRRVRVVNQMPATAAAGWSEWRRYEAAVNVVGAGYRVWGTCAYDIGDVDPGMLRDLTGSHPVVRTSGGPRLSPTFDPRDAGARNYLRVPPHPVEATEPTLSLVDPTAAAARRAVRDLAIRAGLPHPAQEAVIFATSEAVTNAWVHGHAPVRVRAWADGADGTGGTGGPGLTVAVSDGGSGPHPLVGLLPAAPHSLAGHGVWLVHLLLRDIHHRIADDGYTVTFSVHSGDGAPTAIPTPTASGGR